MKRILNFMNNKHEESLEDENSDGRIRVDDTVLTKDRK